MDLIAHGVGGSKDLPLPAEYAIAGACAALAVSFMVLALAWRTPRYSSREAGTPAPTLGAIVDSSWFRGVVRGLGFAFFGYVAFAAVFGRDLQINPVFGVFYRSEEHTSELQSLMRISYAVFCLKKKKTN